MKARIHRGKIIITPMPTESKGVIILKLRHPLNPTVEPLCYCNIFKGKKVYDLPEELKGRFNIVSVYISKNQP
jgi:hypothetical protein